MKAQRHPADDPRVRDLVLKFYEVCAAYQAGTIDPIEQQARRNEIVMALWALQRRLQ